MIKSLTPACDSSESDDDFDKAFQPLINDSNMFLGDTWWSHRKWKTSNAGQILYFWFISHEFQMVKTHDLREYREFDRLLTPKMGDNNDHLEQVILKNGFQEPI